MNRRTLSLCFVASVVASAVMAAESQAQSPAAGPADARCFELRTYTAGPGKLDALNKRFRDHTLKLFKKHGMQVVGFWVPTAADAGAGETLIYLLAHQSRETADASWKAFREDADWIAARNASEVDGRLAAKVVSVFLAPTDYSPMR